MKKILLLVSITFFGLGLLAQTTYSWRSETDPFGSGLWNVNWHWYDGSGESLPSGGEILYFNNTSRPIMTNDLPTTNRHRIVFGTSNDIERVIGGSSANTFYDWGTNTPWIENNSPNNRTQTINFKIINGNNQTGNAFDLKANTGNLIFGGEVSAVDGIRNIYAQGNSNLIFKGKVTEEVDATLNFHVLGSGTTVFEVNNDYTGTTTVSGGTLELQGSIASSAVTVQNGATLKINGDDVTVASLTVALGGNVEIVAGKSLTVSGDFTNNGSITIKSDGTNTGSLIVNADAGTTGTYAVEQTISNDNSWHLISSPVPNFTIIGSDFVPNGSGEPLVLPTTFDFYSFDESENTAPWINIRAAGAEINGNFETTFTKGKGYLVAYSSEYSSTEFNFTGSSINIGNVTTEELTYNSGTTYAGANLIGNPYPSAINWADASKDDFADVYAYIYNTNKGGGAGYEEVSGVIAPNQGFFVVIDPDTYDSENPPTFTFTNALRVEGGSFMKNQTTENKLSIRFGNASNYDEVDIIINSSSEMNRDKNDAIKFFSFDNTLPQINSLSSDNIKLAINSIPEVIDETAIPLQVFIPSENDYFINISSQMGYFEDKPIFLEDLANGNLVKLTEIENYSFTASENDNPNRFLLHFGVVGIGEQEQASTLQAYVVDNRLYVNNSLEQAQLAVYDLQGRLVAGQSLNTAGLQALPLELPAGVYIVRLNNASESRAVKINVQ
ncbi:MAG: T9SS type A sorting domain-containing protein [Lentimicrobiaceae bacterium]|nr:T9SS type A sorting domain-containing protein [Lentimicrobiaceae bacterium]